MICIENGGVYRAMDTEELTIEIRDGKFDFSDFFDECDRFGRSRRLGVKEINMVQLMIEEVVVNHLLNHSDEIEFTIACVKDSGNVEITFSYGGAFYNLYTSEPPESLSIVIIKCLTKKCVHSFHDRNELYVQMQLGVGEGIEIIEQ